MANQNPDGDGAVSSSGRSPYITRVRTETEQAERNSSRSTTQAEWNSSRSTTQSESTHAADPDQPVQGGSVLAGAGALFQSPPSTPRSTRSEQTPVERSVANPTAGSLRGNRFNESGPSHVRLQDVPRGKRRASTLDDHIDSRRPIISAGNKLRASPTRLSGSDGGRREERSVHPDDSDDNGAREDDNKSDSDDHENFQRSLTPRG